MRLIRSLRILDGDERHAHIECAHDTHDVGDLSSPMPTFQATNPAPRYTRHVGERFLRKFGLVPQTANLHPELAKSPDDPRGHEKMGGAATRGDAEIPLRIYDWYGRSVSGTFNIVMGDRGRLVVPAEVRSRSGLTPGTPLVLLDAPDGMILMTREQLSARVRHDLQGTDLVSELLRDRRSESAREDAG